MGHDEAVAYEQGIFPPLAIAAQFISGDGAGFQVKVVSGNSEHLCRRRSTPSVAFARTAKRRKALAVNILRRKMPAEED